jgi:hypothetical protein
VTIPPPTHLVASRTGTTVTLSWVRNPAADYDVVRRDGVRLAQVSGLAYVDRNVPTGPHTYSVQSFSNPSTPAVSITVGAIPLPPTGLTVEIT